MRSLIILSLQLALIAAAPAFAQEGKMRPQPVRGVIEQHEGSTLTVKNGDGKLIAVTLAPRSKSRAW